MPDPADRMMNELERWAVLLLKVTVVCLLLIAYLMAISWWLSPEPPERRVIHQFSEEERRDIEKRHKYHGISISITENGERYFYRDGKRCKL